MTEQLGTQKRLEQQPGDPELRFQMLENILLVTPTFSSKTPAEILAMVKQSGIPLPKRIIVTDFPLYLTEDAVKDDELLQPLEIRTKSGALIGYHFMVDGIEMINVDHHLRSEEFARIVSSTPLMGEYIAEVGPFNRPEDLVFIHHTDGDSVLSAMVAAGLLLPGEPEIDQAAIDGDHTGKANNLADRINAIEKWKDVREAARQVRLYFQDPTFIPENIRSLHDKRLKDREGTVTKAQTLGKAWDTERGIYTIESDEELRAEFLTPAFPDAQVIILAMPYELKTPEDHRQAELHPGKRPLDFRIRLGLQAPQGLQLNKLGLEEVGFGGRWNAGGTKRHGPIFLEPEEFYTFVASRLPTSNK